MQNISLETLGWSLLAFSLPWASVWLVNRWPIFRRADIHFLASGLAWFSSLLPLGAALLNGSVLTHQVGLQSQTVSTWLVGGVLSGGIILAARLLAMRIPVDFQRLDPFDALKGEARWMLYRAATLAWTGDLAAAAGVGFAVGLLEWAIYRRAADPAQLGIQALPGWILRTTLSGLIFLVTHNLILTVSSSFLFLLLPKVNGPTETVVE